MNAATDLIIPKEFLESAKMSAQDLAIEIAVYLYEKKRLTLGQAKRLAGLDQISFQKELAKRNVFIHYDTADVLTDIKNLGIKLKE
jgi:predicted HTH domain antitoxin